VQALSVVPASRNDQRGTTKDAIVDREGHALRRGTGFLEFCMKLNKLTAKQDIATRSFATSAINDCQQ
jgi:hypothetical protein